MFLFFKKQIKNSKKGLSLFLSFFLVCQIIGGAFLFISLTSEEAYASTQNWSFTTAGNYTYDDSKIEISSEQAQLKVTSTPDWYNINWKYRKRITIDYTKVSANLTDFPVLVSSTDADLASKARSDGYDILFTASDGTTKLNHEIERYNFSTGELISWIKADVSSTTDTVLYMYYGNSSASDQSNATGVWDTNFVLVQHLEETGTGTRTDSTSNDNDGTTSGYDGNEAIDSGQINGADDFDESSEYVGINSSTVFATSNAPFTVSAWVNLDDYPGVGSAPDITQLKSDTTYPWHLLFSNNAGYLGISIGSGSTWACLKTDTDSSSLLDTWSYVTVTYNGNGAGTGSNFAIYLNGNSLAHNSSNSYGTQSQNTRIGAAEVSANQWLGTIDEVRISNFARSAGWIETSYNNQNSPSTFYSVGSEASIYDSNNPTIQPTASNSLSFTSLSNFTETATKNGGEIKYILSNDDGATWYYYSSGWTTSDETYNQANTATELNTNITTFPTGKGELLFKAFLHSDGIQLVQLDSITLTYYTGGGMPVTWTKPPAPPIPSVINPKGEFKVTINPSMSAGQIFKSKTTDRRVITLKLSTGFNTKSMIISENPDFKEAIQEPYQETKRWTLSEGDGEKTVYVKFYTKYGQPSKVVSDSIILESKSLIDSNVNISNSTIDDIEKKQIYIDFIIYGTKKTKHLGKGERKGVLYSFHKAYNKLPTNEEDWKEIEKIANGKFPNIQSIEKEKESLKIFGKIYQRMPDFKNPNDETSIKIITYGIRPQNRNMDSEKFAIKVFEIIYGKTPRTTEDWDTVRAIAYSKVER